MDYPTFVFGTLRSFCQSYRHVVVDRTIGVKLFSEWSGSVTMNARVLLLVLVTGMFMTAWNGDQTAMEAAVARRSERQAAAMLAQRQTTEIEVSVSAPEEHSVTVMSNIATLTSFSDTDASTSTNVDLEPDANVTKSLESSDVPLPPGIAAGEYQAVNQTGQTIRVTVISESASGTAAHDFYTVDDKDGSRWYLIRIATSN